MKAGWELKALGSVCTFENGDRGENYPGRSAFVSKGLPIINAGHLSSDGIDTADMNFITRDRYDLLRSGKVRLGDVLFCLRGSLGKFAINDVYEEGAIASSLIIIRPTTKLDTGFLAAYLQSTLCAEMIRKFENGAAQPNLGGKSLEQFLIPLPPLDEQRRIVAVLDKAFAGIATATANAQKNLTNARALFESYLRSVFSAPNSEWQRSNLGKLTSKIGSGATPRGGKDAYKDDGTPLIRSMNVHDRYFKDRNLAFLDDNQAKLLNNVIVQENDVLLNITGASVARCCLAPAGLSGARVNQHVAIIRTVVDKIRPEFLELALTSPYYKDILLGVGEKGGSTRQAITKAEIQSLEVAFPTLAAQTAVVDHATKLQIETRRLAVIVNQKLAALAELKQSLLQKAFAGELT